MTSNTLVVANINRLFFDCVEIPWLGSIPEGENPGVKILPAGLNL